MKHPFSTFLSVCLAITMIMGSVFGIGITAQDTVTLRVGWFYQPGYQEIDDNGQPSGYNYEYLQEISRHNNWSYEFVTKDNQNQELSWESSLEMLKKGQLDLMGCLLDSTQRQSDYDYATLPAGQTFTSLFVRADSPLAANDWPSYNGLTVAAVMATINDENLISASTKHQIKIGSFYACQTTNEVLQAVQSGLVDAGVLASYQTNDDTRIIASFSPKSFYFATTKNNTTILNDLNEAMESILLTSPYYAETLASKYAQTYHGQTSYTAAELDFLKTKPTVSVCFSDAWFPLIEYDHATGKVSGVVGDVLNNIASDTGLQFEYHHVENHAAALSAITNGQYDLLPCFLYNLNLANHNNLSLTNPYLSLQMVQISRITALPAQPVIGTLSGLSSYTLTNQKSVASYKLYDTAEQCFEALKNRQVDEIIINSYTASYYMALTKYNGLIRTARQGLSYEACMCLSDSYENHTLLLSILDKALANISDDQINNYLLTNTIRNSGSMETLINRIPTLPLFVLSLILVTIIVLGLFFCIGYIRKTILVRTEALKAQASAERLNSLLVKDELTGLYNENGFALMMSQRLADKPNADWYLVDFDIDNFKHYNANFSLAQGNHVLRGMAKIVLAILSPDECCGRIYADHFICLLIAENTEELKKRLLELNDHFKGLDTNYNFLFSFGIYPLTNCQIPFDVMRSNAQLAKNTVKGNYEINIGIYDESINDFQTQNNEMVAAMATGLKNGEFVAYYQPKFSAQTEQLVGAEALVRWQHNGKLIPPDSFISLFEKNGLISKLDYYMLDMVCQHLQLLHKQGYDVKPVSVNFSRSHLYEENFLDQLASIIARYQIPSRLIIVEFTEYAVMSEKQGLQKIIDGIHAMGMKLSIDDFGSGYSSLNMLQDFDFDEIKLDRQFLVGTTDLKRQHMIISSLLDLAKKLGMETIVEGVETRQQLLFLRQQHCDAVQGYLFAPPLKIDQYDKLLLPKTAIKNMPSAN